MADRQTLVVSLDDPVASDRARAGSKAANLARLAGAGFPVPPGIVVLPEAENDWPAAVAAIATALRTSDASHFAVRSSAIAEDLEGASFAGQYETELNVPFQQVAEAVRRVFASAADLRVQAYRTARAGALGPSDTSAIAALVQVMVAADAAGVAFTADPVTGDRREAVVSAVRGLGERLVSGDAVPEEWRVRDDARLAAPGEGALDAAHARQVAELARRVEREFRTPQDIEWAIADEHLYLLQARPMTALPAETTWTPPFKAWWLRNLRLGELLPEPVTPLFADWLVPLLETGQAQATREDIGVAVEPASAVINGWYFTTPQGRGTPARLLLRLARRPRSLGRMFTLLIQPFRDPAKADALLSEFARKWRDERQPRYAATVAKAEHDLEQMSVDEVIATVDRIGVLAGVVHWSVETVAGSAWKIEGALASFVRRQIPSFAGSYQEMLIGLPGTEPSFDAHAVHSADWYWPTAGEQGQTSGNPSTSERHVHLREQGEVAAETCRLALKDRPEQLRKFEELLALARTYAVLREQQTRALTLGWPVMRRAVRRLGVLASSRGAVAEPDDVFFLTRGQLQHALSTPGTNLRSVVADERTQWESRRRLVPPLEIGQPPAVARGPIARAVQSARRGGPQRPGALIGHPASPGRATGRVRIVRDTAEFERFLPGEVLVARTTAPAWTPLFARAAAVVTDGGSLAAHASLVAREFGIPAVVATGDATRRLRDGQLVTVDGGAGSVEVSQGRQPDQP